MAGVLILLLPYEIKEWKDTNSQPDYFDWQVTFRPKAVDSRTSLGQGSVAFIGDAAYQGTSRKQCPTSGINANKAFSSKSGND